MSQQATKKYWVSFQARLRWGFVASLFVALLIMMLSIQAILVTQKASSSVIQAYGSNLLIAKDLISLFESRSASGRAYLFTGNSEFLQQSELMQKNFAEKMRALQQKEKFQQGREILTQIQRPLAQYEKFVIQVRQIKASSRSLQPVIRFFDSKVRPAHIKVRQELDRLAEFEQRNFNNALEQSSKASDRVLILFVLLAGLVIVLSAFLGVILTRTLSGLYKISETALSDLRSSEALTKKIIEAALDCIISMDHQGRIVEFNPAAEQVFGYSFSEVVGKDMADIIIPPSLREAHRSGLAHYLATGKGPIMDNRIELSAIRRDGSEFPVELTVTRTRMSGDPLFSGFIRDITERKRVEAEKNRAIEARDELVAVVSHELKNPMSAIATSAELILRRMPTDQRDSVTVKSLEMIRGSIHRMSRLTSDLLDITKVEAGRLTLNESPQNVAHIIDETLESLRPVAEQKKIKLEKSLEAQLPQAYCDRDRIIQVLSNLIGNAIKFSDEARSVFIEAHSIRDEIEFQVRDQGPGIPPEQVGKVFDRFWQAKQTAFKGAGLGLPISKGIVEAHGGKIWVKSKVGEGSTFFFTLKNLAKSSQITASAS